MAMSSSDLCLHAGGRLVTEEELRQYRAPQAEGRWFPIAHHDVLVRVKDTLGEAGFEVRGQKLALAKQNHRFFGTLDLKTQLASGVHLAVGIRNSTDKSFPLGFCAGSRVFVCDNLAFRSELLVKRKHTRFGEQRFGAAIANAVSSLHDFRQMEEERLRLMMHAELAPEMADAVILRAFEKGIIGARDLPAVIKEWRNPSFEEFKPRTAWSLLNAFTTVLRERAEKQPQAFMVQTMRLNSLLDAGQPHHELAV
jgi:hypothetical protein